MEAIHESRVNGRIGVRKLDRNLGARLRIDGAICGGRWRAINDGFETIMVELVAGVDRRSCSEPDSTHIVKNAG
jgi:hypothetical protein